MAEAKVPSGQWLPTVGVTGQIFAMTANNTTGTYVEPDFMDVPRIGATASTATGSLSPYASTLVGAGLLQEVFDFGRIGAQRAAADALDRGREAPRRHRPPRHRLQRRGGVLLGPRGQGDRARRPTTRTSARACIAISPSAASTRGCARRSSSRAPRPTSLASTWAASGPAAGWPSPRACSPPPSARPIPPSTWRARRRPPPTCPR